MHINQKSSSEDRERIRIHVRDRVREAIAGQSWVWDGFYTHIQSEIAERADLVIFLDIPLWRRLLNHAERVFKPRHRHKEVALWGDLKFFAEIVRRNYANRSKYNQFLAAHEQKIIRLRSRQEINTYLERMKRPKN